METFSIIILPFIVLSIILYGYNKKINIYESFLKGVIEGLKTSLTVFPNLLAMIFAVNILISSGIINTVFSFLNSFLSAFSLSTDILSMSLIRPISGTASLAIMNNIFARFYYGKTC